MDKRSLFFVLALTAALFLINHWFDSKEQERKAERKLEIQGQAVPPPASQPPPLTPAPLPASATEQLYVLENSYQQLVFSNIGGALVEINLPLQSAQNRQSVVLPIGFDRMMLEQNSENDYFPLSSALQVDPNGKVTERERTLGGYTPLLRRSIIGSSGRRTVSISPQLYALNLVADDPATGELNYAVVRFEKGLIEFQASDAQRKITKTFSFPANEEAPYCLNLKVKIDGDARGLRLTSGVPEVELISDNSNPAIKYRLTRQQKSQVEQIDLPKKSSTFTSVEPDWVCNSNGFLGLILDPLTARGPGFSAYMIPGETAPTRLTLIDAAYDLYPAAKYPGYALQLPLCATDQNFNFRIFAGPFDNAILKKIDAIYSDPARSYNPDYAASQSFHGWFSFISEPFAKFLFLLMKFFHQITRSWGLSILLLTVALRVMLYPLNAWSIKATTKMQQIAPQISALQEKYKKDPKRAQMETVALYREKGVNPFSGCLPLLIQMPFLIGMFDLLKSSFELRGVPFIPGWIDNLTAPDIVFSWGYPLFFFGTSFHLLPLILGAVMYVQQKISSPLPKDTTMLTDQQKQQRFMGNIMVILFAVMFYHFPSGLNLYWLSSMLLGILQQWHTSRQHTRTK